MLAASAKTRIRRDIFTLETSVRFKPTERPADGAVALRQGGKAGREAFPSF